MRDVTTVVREAFAGAVGAAGEDAEFAVDAGASALAAAGWEQAGPAVVAAADDLLSGCRARGWGDPDLVRMARRELGPEHVRLAERLLAADGGPRTEAAALLTGYAREERMDRFGAATAVLELVRLLGRLPRITPLTAAPPRPSAGGGAGSKLGRIRALLAKAESTPYPEEAEALSAKAQHLMARYSVDEALVAGTAPGDGPGARRVGVDRPYEAPKALLLDAVAAANRCRAVWSAEFGFSTVVGYEADLEAVEVLYTSLLVQAEAAMLRGGAPAAGGGTTRPKGRKNLSRNFRESFLIAYAGRIGDRLATATRDATREAGEESGAAAEVLPVLAAREVAVGRAADQMFPQTRSQRLKGRDREGWEHGTAAADGAQL
ncbi:DUF2786 domain-containing protein [Streptomyces sp. NPDC088354]|uniref:DUF2786 domain-containing protein n=1 Tax=Streptomyces sp. NPDC088354 TaxID=3365856 RepID=UPI0038260C0B